ncbi:MAG: hypothetical protein RL115_1744 [Bacteroidota bacterium]|jgi:8-oxo-dGTP pyrophosphatase MutT (NUDIX family)
MQIYTAGLLLIKNRKLLMAYSNHKHCFYLPGGKLEKGETALQALCREVKEELNLILKEDELIYYTHITAPAYGENTDVTMEQACFMANKCLYPKASAEIGKIRYFTMDEYLEEKFQAPGAIMILQKLQTDNLID